METNIESQVIDNKNEETFSLFDNELSTDLKSAQIEAQYYDWIRGLFAILISVGYPLNDWLTSADPLRVSYKKYRPLWVVHRVFHWFFTHLVFVAILVSLFQKQGIHIFGHIMLFCLNYPSIYLMDSYYDLCGEEASELIQSFFTFSEQIKREDYIQRHSKISSYLKVISDVALIAVPLVVIMMCSFTPFHGLNFFIFTLTALNLTTIWINFVVFTKFYSLLILRLNNLDIKIQAGIHSNNISNDLMEIFEDR